MIETDSSTPTMLVDGVGNVVDVTATVVSPGAAVATAVAAVVKEAPSLPPQPETSVAIAAAKANTGRPIMRIEPFDAMTSSGNRADGPQETVTPNSGT